MRPVGPGTNHPLTSEMAILDAIIKKVIQGKLKFMGIDWAKVESVTFSKEDHLVHVTMDLDGEDAPVTAMVNYRVDGEDLVVESVETNKRWMTETALIVLQRNGGKVELPPAVRGMVLKAIT